MSEEMKSEWRSPSPVARLMGMDGVPPGPLQQSTCKQQKKPPGNHLWEKMSFEKSRRCVTPDDNLLSTRSSKQQQKTKDVYEIFETSMKERRHFSEQKVVKSKPSQTQMEYIQNNLMDAKCLAIDAKLQSSKEYHDELEVLGSNKDLLLKYFRQPYSLFEKHIDDINATISHSNCRHLEALKSSDDKNPECYDMGKKSVRRNPRGRRTKPRKHHSSHFSPSDCNYASLNSAQISRVKLEEDEGLVIFPKKIVVLKPNLGKVQKAPNLVLPTSLDFQSDRRKQSEYGRTTTSKMETLRRKGYLDHVQLSRHENRECEGVSKKTIRRMKENFDAVSLNSSLEITGCDRDADTCYIDDGKYYSRDRFGFNGQCRSSSFRYKKSFISREARNQLAERWKMSCNSHDVGVVSRSCTLAEMLAMPDQEIKSAYLKPRFGGEGSSGKFFNDESLADCVEPLGISSREGWKDISLGKLSRSRSLPAPSTSFESSKPRHECLSMGRILIPKEAFKWERKETICESLCRREPKVHRNSRCSRKKSHSSICAFEVFNDPVLKIYTSQNQDSDFRDDDSGERNLLAVEESPFNPLKDQPQVLENMIDVKVRSDDVVGSSNEELQPELSVLSMVKDNSNSVDADSLMPKEPWPEMSQDTLFHLKSAPGLESPVSSKEADQPSPVSVLEPHFSDEPTVSDCFESLSADLHGLRMQLKLLKLETEVTAEELQHISSDEDMGEGSTEFVEEKDECKTEGSWECSYLTDILHCTTLNDINLVPDTFIRMWDSRECPISPSIFEELEKKYTVSSSPSRLERKLIFDLINIGLMDMYQKLNKPYPWTWLRRPPPAPTPTPTVQVGFNEGVYSNLSKLLENQGRKVNDDIVEKVLERTNQWWLLGNDIDMIGKEIEILLLDELLEEAVGL